MIGQLARRQWTAVVITAAARFGVILVGVGTSVITARALGTTGRGEYFAAVTLAGIVAQFSNLGLSSSNTFLAARAPASAGALLANSTWIGIICWLAGSVLIAAAGHAISVRSGIGIPALILAMFLAPGILMQVLLSSLLIADERFSVVNGWLVCNAVGVIIVLAACAAANVNSTGFLAATSACAMLTAVGMWVSVRRRHAGSLKFDVPLFRRGLAFASRAYLAALGGYLMQRVATTILIAAGDLRGLGVYSVASQIYDVLLILPGSVGLVLFPRLIKNRRGAWHSTRQALVATVSLMALACAVAATVGRWLIPLAFGAQFADAYRPMLALLPAVLCMTSVMVLSQYLVAQAFPIRLVVAWIAGVSIAVAAGYHFSKVFGVVGVAWGQSCAAAFVLVCVVGLTIVKFRDEAASAK